MKLGLLRVLLWVLCKLELAKVFAVSSFRYFRWFWKRGYEYFIDRDFLFASFLWSALGVLFVLVGCVSDVHERFYLTGIGLVWSVWVLSLFAFYRFSFLLFFSLLAFPVIYFLFVAFVSRLFVFLK